eukprot:220939-Pleurochrysis_carterae.AAC.2
MAHDLSYVAPSHQRLINIQNSSKNATDVRQHVQRAVHHLKSKHRQQSETSGKTPTLLYSTKAAAKGTQRARALIMHASFAPRGRRTQSRSAVSSDPSDRMLLLADPPSICGWSGSLPICNGERPSPSRRRRPLRLRSNGRAPSGDAFSDLATAAGTDHALRFCRLSQMRAAADMLAMPAWRSAAAVGVVATAAAVAAVATGVARRSSGRRRRCGLRGLRAKSRGARAERQGWRFVAGKSCAQLRDLLLLHLEQPAQLVLVGPVVEGALVLDVYKQSAERDGRAERRAQRDAAEAGAKQVEFHSLVRRERVAVVDGHAQYCHLGLRGEQVERRRLGLVVGHHGAKACVEAVVDDRLEADTRGGIFGRRQSRCDEAVASDRVQLNADGWADDAARVGRRGQSAQLRDVLMVRGAQLWPALASSWQMVQRDDLQPRVVQALPRRRPFAPFAQLSRLEHEAKAAAAAEEKGRVDLLRNVVGLEVERHHVRAAPPREEGIRVVRAHARARRVDAHEPVAGGGLQPRDARVDVNGAAVDGRGQLRLAHRDDGERPLGLAFRLEKVLDRQRAERRQAEERRVNVSWLAALRQLDGHQDGRVHAPHRRAHLDARR